MFIGSWIINFVISCTAFLLVFIGSMSTNTLFTSFFRGCLTFIVFFIIAYPFRLFLMLASQDTSPKNEHVSEIEATSQGNDKVNQEDYTNEDITKVSQYVKDLIND